MVVFRDGQRGMEHHPVDEIGELAHPAADPRGRNAIPNGQPFPIALTGGTIACQPPKGKGFAGADQNFVHMGSNQRKVDRLVFLEDRIGVSELSPDQGGMAFDSHRKQGIRLNGSEFFPGDEILQSTLPNFFPGGELVGQRGYFAEKTTLHNSLLTGSFRFLRELQGPD